jgi:hypothetical protein
MSRLTKILVTIALIAGLASTACFFVQGGFGGGHAQLDFAIVILGLPSIALLGWLDTPSPSLLDVFNGLPDIFVIIWLPTLLNVLVFYLLGAGITSLRRMRSAGKGL